MDDGRGESASQREGIHPDWTAVSIGIMTIATIVAAGTVAAAISVSREATNGIAAIVTGLAVGIAWASLAMYYAVIVMGLSTLFRTSSSERGQQAKRAAIGLNIQVYAVVIFALIAIVGPFLVVEQG